MTWHFYLPTSIFFFFFSSFFSLWERIFLGWSSETKETFIDRVPYFSQPTKTTFQSPSANKATFIYCKCFVSGTVYLEVIEHVCGKFVTTKSNKCSLREPSVNSKDLRTLTLVGPAKDNPELDPLAVLHLDNRLFLIEIEIGLN